MAGVIRDVESSMSGDSFQEEICCKDGFCLIHWEFASQHPSDGTKLILSKPVPPGSQSVVDLR